MPFSDNDPNNDFIGFRGEVKNVTGGQGGGGGGSMLDGYYCGDWCFWDADPSNDNICQGIEFPGVGSGAVGDARGAGGGAGGGAVMIRALGAITIAGTGRIECDGGLGGGAEQRACSNYAGAGGGGAGGAIVLQSGDSIVVRPTARLRAEGADWKIAGANFGALGTCDVNHDPWSDNYAPGDGGAGGHGIIQLQVPFGQVAQCNPNSLRPSTSWSDPENLLNPSEFSSQSTAVSTWFDLGRAVERPPLGSAPHYRFFLNGSEVLEGDSGQVKTDAGGFVVFPDETDIHCGYLGRISPLSGQYEELPQENFIPLNASVRLEFQGAQAQAPGSREVDPLSLTTWSPSAAVADGRQFIRYRVFFDISLDGTSITDSPRLPVVTRLRIRAEF
jgi:hypothetical protein